MTPDAAVMWFFLIVLVAIPLTRMAFDRVKRRWRGW